MQLNERIKSERNKINLSQEQLAQQVFVSRVTISNWENAKTFPDIESLLLLSKIFNTSIDSLVREEDLDVDLNERMYKFGKLQSKYQSYVVLIFIIAIMAVIFQNLNLMNYAMLLMLTLVLVAIRLHYIEKDLKKYSVNNFTEVMSFLKGNSLEDIKASRNKISQLRGTIYMLLLGFVGFFVISFIVTMIMQVI